MIDVIAIIPLILLSISLLLFIICNIIEIVNTNKFWKRMEEDRKKMMEVENEINGGKK